MLPQLADVHLARTSSWHGLNLLGGCARTCYRLWLLHAVVTALPPLTMCHPLLQQLFKTVMLLSQGYNH